MSAKVQPSPSNLLRSPAQSRRNPTASSSSTPLYATASSRPDASCTARKSCAWPTRSPPSASTSWRPASPSPPRATLNPSATSPAKSDSPRPHHRLPRPRQARGHRGRRALHRARPACPHPHLPLHLRPSPGRQAQDHPRRGARPDRRHGRPRPHLLRRCRILARGRHPHRPRFPGQGL